MSEEKLEQNSGEVTLAEVRDWVESHDYLEGRFRFFDVYKPNSVFYRRVARPLLSMRTTGSMSVERQAKNLKYNLLRKERNRLSDERGNVLYYTAQNMRLLAKAKMAVKGTVYDVLSRRGRAAGRGPD